MIHSLHLYLRVANEIDRRFFSPPLGKRNDAYLIQQTSLDGLYILTTLVLFHQNPMTVRIWLEIINQMILISDEAKIGIRDFSVMRPDIDESTLPMLR